MSEPKKWTEDGASPRARELLASARPPRRPSEVERARSFERVQTVAALPQAPSLGPWTTGVGAVAAVGIAAILMTTASTGTRSRQPSAFLPTADVSIPVVPTAAPPVIAAFLEPMGPPVLSGAELSGPRSTLPPLPAALVPSATHTAPALPTPSAALQTVGSDPNDAPKEEDSMLREARILERARSALALNPSQALTLCEEHEHQFPTGQLQAERELLEVDALGRLGRYGLARERARSLLLGSAFYAERTRRLVDAMPKGAGSLE